jgi:hypothetical protein
VQYFSSGDPNTSEELDNWMSNWVLRSGQSFGGNHAVLRPERTAGSLVGWLEVSADEYSQRGFELRREGQRQGEIVG